MACKLDPFRNLLENEIRMHKANFNEIAHRFHGVIFDIYGVLWNGAEFYPRILESLFSLRKQGKVIGLLSNATQLNQAAQEKYRGHGLVQGTHYDFLLTSGEVARSILLQHALKEIKIPKHSARCYVIGRTNDAMFADTAITVTQNLDEADFGYIGVLQINGRGCSDVLLFMEQLKLCRARNLPLFCANPDYYAQEASGYVACQGLVAQAYEDMGGLVEWCGKPYLQVFDACMKELVHHGVREKSKMVIIGDTLRTDILGGFRAGIQTVLVTNTGVAADAILQGETLEAQIQCAGVTPDFTIDQVAGTVESITQ